MSDEKIIEQRSCISCGIPFVITDQDIEFYNKIIPTFNGVAYPFPTPTHCPDCRQQRRILWRNERKLYKRKCDLTGKDIISTYSPDKVCRVYDQKERWGANRDPKSFGIDIDPTISFFEQFKILDSAVPKMSISIQNSENCDFTNDTGDSMNCYMSFRTHYSENLMYTYRGNRSTNCMDCYQIKESENLYECFQCDKCQNGKYLYNCNVTHTSAFLWNCTGCANCLLSVNLNNANYCIRNKQYTKEEYQKFIEEIQNDPTAFDAMRDEFFKIINGAIICKDLDNVNSENSVGNELIECRDCHDCYMMKSCETCRHAWDNVGYKTCMDNYSGGTSELCYETTAAKKCLKNFSTVRTRESNNLYYSAFMFSCHDCFGCIGLTNAQCCIFNKQYTPQEYEVQVAQIVERMKANGTWGEFFPGFVSPYGYNETVAYEYFPLTKEDAIKKGFNRSDYEAPFPVVDKILKASDLPKDSKLISDDIVKQAIECEISHRPFRLIKTELDFYRKHNLPLPRRHPDVRHEQRMKFSNPRKLWDRSCAKCGIAIKTSYAPERSVVVYCQACYNKQFY